MNKDIRQIYRYALIHKDHLYYEYEYDCIRIFCMYAGYIDTMECNIAKLKKERLNEDNFIQKNSPREDSAMENLGRRKR